MPDRTVLIDAGWFVGRWRRHLYAKRGFLARILAGVANGNCDPAKGVRAGRRAITQDLKYLSFRFRQFGLSSADVIVCYDGTRARQRRGALLETYKANRIMIHPEATEREAEEIIESYRASESTIQDMRDHFASFEFPLSLYDNWSHRYTETHEADDLIADYVVAAPATEQITVVSADSDLVQLLAYPNVQILDPTAGDQLQALVTTESVVSKYGVSPEAYADWKALAGDSSDNIPGLPEIGGVKAASLVTEHGSLESIPDEHFSYARVSESWRQNLPAHLRSWIDAQTRRDGTPAGEDLVARRHGRLIVELVKGESPTRPSRYYQTLIDAGALPESAVEIVDLRPTAMVYRRMIRLPFE